MDRGRGDGKGFGRRSRQNSYNLQVKENRMKDENLTIKILYKRRNLGLER